MATKTAAKKTTTKAAAPKKEEVKFGTAQLVDHINDVAGTDLDAYGLRVLLRKLTAEGVLNREEGGRSRYSFTGANDPQVKAIVKAVKEGKAEKAKEERNASLKKSREAAKPAAAKKKTTTTRTKKATKPVEVEEEDDDDLEVDDI